MIFFKTFGNNLFQFCFVLFHPWWKAQKPIPQSRFQKFHVQLFVFCVQTVLKMIAPLPYPQTDLKRKKAVTRGSWGRGCGDGGVPKVWGELERKHKCYSPLQILDQVVKEGTQTPVQLWGGGGETPRGPKSSTFQTVTTPAGKKDSGGGEWVKSKCLEGQTQIYKRKLSVINQNALHNIPHTSEVFLKMGVSGTWKLLCSCHVLVLRTVDNPDWAGVGLLQRWERDRCFCNQAGLYKAFLK